GRAGRRWRAWCRGPPGPGRRPSRRCTPAGSLPRAHLARLAQEPGLVDDEARRGGEGADRERREAAVARGLPLPPGPDAQPDGEQHGGADEDHVESLERHLSLAAIT